MSNISQFSWSLCWLNYFLLNDQFRLYYFISLCSNSEGIKFFMSSVFKMVKTQGSGSTMLVWLIPQARKEIRHAIRTQIYQESTYGTGLVRQTYPHWLKKGIQVIAKNTNLFKTWRGISDLFEHSPLDSCLPYISIIFSGTLCATWSPSRPFISWFIEIGFSN